MPHICYIYVYDYRCLHDVDITFDHRYCYSFDSEKAKLTITAPAYKLPKDFWGAGIWSLTGIVGNNGAGKTTVNRILLEAVVEGLTTKDLKCVIVYENNKTLQVYHNNPTVTKTITVEKIDNVPYDVTTIKQSFDHLPNIDTFFYQGHFSAEFSSSNLCSTELAGLYNATEGYLLRKDFEKFANATDLYYTCPISSYLVSHISQKHQRICRLLINEELRSKITQFRFPRYLTFSPNRGGQDHIKFHPLVSKETKEALQGMLEPLPHQGIVPTKEEYIGMFIYFNLLNAIADNVLPSGGPEVLKQWRETVNHQQNVMPQFQRLIDKQQDGTIKNCLQTIHDVLHFIFDLTHYDENGAFYIDIFNEKDKIEAILDANILDTFYLTSRFFDMHYSHNYTMGDNQMSSGEEVNLNLYALLYDAIELRYNKFKIAAPSLILLDEAEIGFHPEWQRTFINTFLDVLHALKVKQEHDYQVVITSHSPILLSDIPVCCCNYLERDEEGHTHNTRTSQPQTFASNIFDLYRHSFFLHDGLIGAFAMNRIVQMQQRVMDPQDKGIDNEIELVGDQHICQYLKDKRSAVLQPEMNVEELKAYYRRKLSELEDLSDE